MPSNEPAIEFSAETRINAPASSVWRLMIEAAREPEWMRAVRSAEFVGPQRGYALGACMRRRGRFLGIEIRWDSEIVALEPDRRIVFRHTGGAIGGESLWEVIPTAEGCCVRLASRGPAPRPLARFPALAAMIGRVGLRGDLARLKRLAEVPDRRPREAGDI
jgi:uncharacterized membrane protein